MAIELATKGYICDDIAPTLVLQCYFKGVIDTSTAISGKIESSSLYNAKIDSSTQINGIVRCAD